MAAAPGQVFVIKDVLFTDPLVKDALFAEASAEEDAVAPGARNAFSPGLPWPPRARNVLLTRRPKMRILAPFSDAVTSFSDVTSSPLSAVLQ